ncbi:MAG: SGNH/GDSL hydrolase family protein [Chitinophagaceae bacterium]
MRYFSSLLMAILFFAAADTASAQKKLVIIGSSTSACTNVNSVTECYVGRLRTYYEHMPPEDTTVNGNLALGGTNCYNGMPSSYTTSPYPAYQPNLDRNITAALRLRPDVVIVNYPTNDYNTIRTDSILFCLRTIRDSANKEGVPCFVTTTQPRTSAGYNTSVIKAKLAELKDSILLQFGLFAIDFYTGLINPADSSILYDSGDQIHMNAAGHDILFQRVLAKNIFLASLPATFLNFNTIYKNNTNIINWATAKETDVAFYEIQRSADGRSFSKIATVNANNNYGSNQYQYTDDQPLKAWNYYKIIIVDRDGKKHASPVMSVHINTGKLALVKAFVSSSSQVAVELQNNEPQNIQFQIVSNMGMLISSASRKIEAGNTTVYLDAPLLSNGIYHIKLITAKESMVGSFIKN